MKRGRMKGEERKEEGRKMKMKEGRKVKEDRGDRMKVVKEGR